MARIRTIGSRDDRTLVINDRDDRGDWNQVEISYQFPVKDDSGTATSGSVSMSVEEAKTLALTILDMWP